MAHRPCGGVAYIEWGQAKSRTLRSTPIRLLHLADVADNRKTLYGTCRNDLVLPTCPASVVVRLAPTAPLAIISWLPDIPRCKIVRGGGIPVVFARLDPATSESRRERPLRA